MSHPARRSKGDASLDDACRDYLRSAEAHRLATAAQTETPSEANETAAAEALVARAEARASLAQVVRSAPRHRHAYGAWQFVIDRTGGLRVCMDDRAARRWKRVPALW